MNRVSFEGSWKIAKEHNTEDIFLNECEKICSDENLFKSFKRNSVFTRIIGNDIRSRDISDVFYNNIKNSALMQKIDVFKTNDIYGMPYKYYYNEIGDISPGTLCFCSILKDIEENFIDLKNLNVCEIGTGYGGQAKILLDYGVKKVTLVDRKQTLRLAKKYLDLFGYTNVEYYSTDEIEVKESDLIISNWCISELDRDGISFYISNLVKAAKFAYFLVNFRAEKDQDFFVFELKKVFSSVRVEEENPKTSRGQNYVIYCSK